MKRRTDNMPAKLTAHAVRRLTSCSLCRGLGDRTLMVNGDTHTSCFAEKFGFKGLTELSGAEIGKLRLDDISKLSVKQQRAVLAKHRPKTAPQSPCIYDESKPSGLTERSGSAKAGESSRAPHLGNADHLVPAKIAGAASV